MIAHEVLYVLKRFAGDHFSTEFSADLEDTDIAAGTNTQANRISFSNTSVIVSGDALRYRKVHTELNGWTNAPASSNIERG